MYSFSDIFENVTAENTYFIGANTPNGFLSDYKSYINEEDFDKVYILKGGSGTGKSTVMRKIAEASSKKGATVTRLLCSSDPESLDGVIITKKKKKIAIIDGTAPHTTDPEIPGAVGEIVNLGNLWKSDKLEKKKDVIISLIKEKTHAYKCAYRYLSALGDTKRMINKYGKEAILSEKLDKFIERLADNSFPIRKDKENGKITNVRTLAISMRGAKRLTTFENAEHLITVDDFYDISAEFYKRIKSTLLARGYDVTLSISPLDEIFEINVPECDISFVPLREGIKAEKNINLERFIDKKRVAAFRQKKRFAEKCSSALMKGVLDNLDTARSIHFRIEDIYKSAMDFTKADAMTEELTAAVLKRLSR